MSNQANFGNRGKLPPSSRIRQPSIGPQHVRSVNIRPHGSDYVEGQHRLSGTRYQPHQIPVEPREMLLVSNAYNISVKTSSCSLIYEYILFVEPSKECHGLPSKVLTKAFVSRSIRKLLLEDIIPQISDKSVPRGTILIEPNLEAIFTQHPLISNKSSGDKISSQDDEVDQQKFYNIAVSTDLISNLSVDIVIRYSKTHDPRVNNHSLYLITSILHHQLLTDMLRFESVYFMPSEISSEAIDRLDLISRHFMGISISGSRRADNNQTLVIINCSHSYITQAHRLIDLIASYLEGRPIVGLELRHNPQTSLSVFQEVISPKIASMKLNDEIFKGFCSILLGFKCRYEDSNGKRVNLRFHPTDKSALELHLNPTTTVYEYYKAKGINLNYPNLPCLQANLKVNKLHYYPLELCTLISGQKVPIFRLSSQARNHMQALNKPDPNISWSNSVKARDEIKSRNRDQFKSYGLQLSSKPAQALGSTLIKPVLQFKDKSLLPARDFWESSAFFESLGLIDNWCLVDTVGLETDSVVQFFKGFSDYSNRFGFQIGPPNRFSISKQDIVESRITVDAIIKKCSQHTKRELRFIMFIIDSNSTMINRLIHLEFDANPKVTATCLRAENVLKTRQHRAIYRSLVHKINSRLGGTNLTFDRSTWERLSLECSDLMIVGLDVTHPDNELNGVSIVGCAFTYSKDLFRHKSLVWPQAARKEIIGNMDKLMERLLNEYQSANENNLPHQIIVYRDGVSHEEFDRVRDTEITKASEVIDRLARSCKDSLKPNLSYIIAQKRHTMRFFKLLNNDSVENPPGGTLINQGVVPQESREFYLYSNTSPRATARPLHYHVLLNGLGMENLQKITYYLCFNFGRCSSSLSMPSSLRYAHNAAYDARNRVIASREFQENKFYTTKFFC